MIEQIEQIKQTLTERKVDYKKIIKDLGQDDACEKRLNGKSFDFSEHIKGLIYAQLSAQRPWQKIADSQQEINNIFGSYDIKFLKEVDPNELIDKIQNFKCGNRRIAKQIQSIYSNIKMFEKISCEHGSLDSFVTSKPKSPEIIAKKLSSGKYKLKEIGFTLAMEYLKNVGIDAIKPDVHICRIISHERLGFIDKKPSPEEAYKCLIDIAKQAKCSAVFIDNLLWIFAAKDYGNICSEKPKCNKCSVNLCPKNPSHSFIYQSQ